MASLALLIGTSSSSRLSILVAMSGIKLLQRLTPLCQSAMLLLSLVRQILILRLIQTLAEQLTSCELVFLASFPTLTMKSHWILIVETLCRTSSFSLRSLCLNLECVMCGFHHC
jgi:hypothetical protein